MVLNIFGKKKKSHNHISKDSINRAGFDTNFEAVILQAYSLSRKMFITGIVMIVVLVIYGSIAMYVGKSKSYIIIRDATGRPTRIITDNPSKIYTSELNAFVGDFVGDFFSWDYAAVMDSNKYKEKIKYLSRYFDSGFFKGFARSLHAFFVKSIYEERLVTRPGVYKIKFVQIKGRKANLIISVDLNIYKVSTKNIEGATFETKTYKMEVQRGERKQNNLYGLYITGFTEYEIGK